MSDTDTDACRTPDTARDEVSVLHIIEKLASEAPFLHTVSDPPMTFGGGITLMESKPDT